MPLGLVFLSQIAAPTTGRRMLDMMNGMLLFPTVAQKKPLEAEK